MDIAQLVRTTILFSIVLLVFGLGLRAMPGDAISLFRAPALLLRSLLAMNVVVPLLAVVLAAMLDLHPAVKIALVTMAVSPVPPFLPGKQLKLVVREAYVYGLLVATALLAALLVPLTLAILDALFGRNMRIEPAEVARIVALTVLIPLALGIAVRYWSPGRAERLSSLASGLGTVLLVVAGVPLLVLVWPAAAALIGDGTVLAIILLTVLALAVGHFLGGPKGDDRTVLALVSATRHPAVALAIAHASFPDEKLAPAAVLLYLIVSTVASAPYTAWRKRLHARSPLFVSPERGNGT